MDSGGPSKTVGPTYLHRRYQICDAQPVSLRPLLSILLTVQLTPREQEKLLIYVAADLARRRRQRGLKLNLPESTALITEAMLEGARDGRSAGEVMELGRHVLTRQEVMAEVPDLLHVVQVEATFPDGTKLVSCHDPIP
jgi:urease subunit gamma